MEITITNVEPWMIESFLTALHNCAVGVGAIAFGIGLLCVVSVLKN